MKKTTVVHVSGISRSGSTALASSLAKKENGLFVGELEAVLFPYRKHHFRVWKFNQYWNYYSKCFEEVLLIDSSKSPNYILLSILLNPAVNHRIVVCDNNSELVKASYSKRGLDFDSTIRSFSKKFSILLGDIPFEVIRADEFIHTYGKGGLALFYGSKSRVLSVEPKAGRGFILDAMKGIKKTRMFRTFYLCRYLLKVVIRSIVKEDYVS